MPTDHPVPPGDPSPPGCAGSHHEGARLGLVLISPSAAFPLWRACRKAENAKVMEIKPFSSSGPGVCLFSLLCNLSMALFFSRQIC